MRDRTALEPIVGLSDVHVYATVSNSWRAYVRNNAGLQAWGLTQTQALGALAKVLSRAGIAFDLTGDTR